MFRRKQRVNVRQEDADEAVRLSQRDLEAVQALKPQVEETVRGHIKLQLENHFAERIWIAYRGDY